LKKITLLLMIILLTGYATSQTAYIPGIDVVALVRVNPTYPQRAFELGVTGFCTVYFTITALGDVRDAYVPYGPEHCSNSVFIQSSIQAIEQFKFWPKIVDGEAVEIEHANRFIFALED